MEYHFVFAKNFHCNTVQHCYCIYCILIPQDFVLANGAFMKLWDIIYEVSTPFPFIYLTYGLLKQIKLKEVYISASTVITAN